MVILNDWKSKCFESIPNFSKVFFHSQTSLNGLHWVWHQDAVLMVNCQLSCMRNWQNVDVKLEIYQCFGHQELMGIIYIGN